MVLSLELLPPFNKVTLFVSSYSHNFFLCWSSKSQKFNYVICTVFITNRKIQKYPKRIYPKGIVMNLFNPFKLKIERYLHSLGSKDDILDDTFWYFSHICLQHLCKFDLLQDPASLSWTTLDNHLSIIFMFILKKKSKTSWKCYEQ